MIGEPSAAFVETHDPAKAAKTRLVIFDVRHETHEVRNNRHVLAVFNVGVTSRCCILVDEYTDFVVLLSCRCHADCKWVWQTNRPLD